MTLNEDEVHRHAPLITTLRYGKKSRQVELAAQLTMSFTEVGTLELWLNSLNSDHRWRLQFQLRGAQAAIEHEEEEAAAEESQTVISEEALALAEGLIRAVFGGPVDALKLKEDEAVTPQNLVGRIEAVFGYGKDAWPMIAIRKLCDTLADVADGRKKSPRHEARWLTLFGFCLRPGFGAPADDWRISQARKIYMAGLKFPRELQCQVEWLVLWRRVAGGLNVNQQNELFHRHKVALGVGGKNLAGGSTHRSSAKGGDCWPAWNTCHRRPAWRSARNCWSRSRSNPRIRASSGHWVVLARGFRSTARSTASSRRRSPLNG